MLANAKINLFLHVVGKVGNYHSLESLVVFTKNIGDRVEYTPGMDYKLIIDGPFAHQLKECKENSIVKAAKFFKNKYNIQTTGTFRLVKNLPVGSGIGGGTADAGAILRIFSQMHNININPVDLSNIGADVPACYISKPLYFQNIGDQISPVFLNFTIPIILVNPMVTTMTDEIFKKYNNNHNHYSKTIYLVDSFNHLSELVNFLKPLNNDLQNFVHSTNDVLTVLASYNPLIYRMSGSGATCFAIFDNIDTAKKIAKEIANNYKDWWVVSGEC